MSNAQPPSGNVDGDSASNEWNGRLLIVCAALMWSASGFFAKAPWFDGWPKDSRGLMLAFWRSLFAISVLIPLIRKPQWHPSLITMCLSFVVMVWSFLSAMIHGPAANAIWLQYLAPVWVMLFGVILLGERVTRSDIQMFFCCLAGVLLIVAMELRTGGSATATALGIVSGLSYAGVVLHFRRLRHLDSAWLTTLNHSATVCVLLPWVFGPWATAKVSDVSWEAYAALALFGIFQMSVPYVLFARGLKTISSPEASILALIEPIVLPIWVFVAWHHHPSYEAPGWWTWVGGSLILTGLLLRYLPRRS